jgi:hypothetical protein
VALIGVPSAYATKGGGDSAGGGSTIRCLKQTRPFLLDRLSLNPQLAEKGEVVTALAVQPTMPSEKQSEISSIYQSDREAFQLAIQKLKSWEQGLPDNAATSKALMGILIKTIQGTSYKRTSHQFNKVSRYQLARSLERKCRDIQTAILYLPLYGCIISSPVWDTLDLETQAGLIVHEALRQVQGLHGLYDLTDEQLQSITAQIMDGTPSATSSFQSWMSPKLTRLCFVTAGATSGTDASNAADQAIAKLAISMSSELDSALDQNQKVRSQTLSSPEALKQLLEKLIKGGILKE